MHGGLVCLVSRAHGPLDGNLDASTPKFQLILAVIARRDTESLAKDEQVARISVTLADPLQYLLLLNSASETSSKHWFLVESPGAYFGSYRPILKALQLCIPASLPFGKYLAPTTEEQAEIQNVRNFVDPPIYARAPTFQFDLSVLLKGQECLLDVSSTVSVEKTKSILQKDSTLDASQSKALVETLCREVALIHAPPGTGMMLIGFALVQVLRANKARSECGSILYICNTGDALDRFLEQCLDKVVLDIVHVGAGSKSKRLEQYNLEELLDGHKRPYQVERALEEVARDFASSSKRIGDLEHRLKGDCMDWKNVQSHLEHDYPDTYKQFQPARNDAHQSPDDKVKEEHANCSFDRWRTGLDIQENSSHGEENNAADQECNLPACQMMPPTNGSVDLFLDGDVWSMTMQERERLLDQWRPKVQRSLTVQLSELIKHVENLNNKKNDAMNEFRRAVLRKHSVVAMTINGASESQELIKKLAPRIIIYEEAGQILESHILATLSPSTQHLILIGDHKQLRPQIETYNLSSDSPIGKKYNLDMSLFERLATSVMNLLPLSKLTTQRRMRPSVSSLIRRALYPDIEDGDNVHSYQPVCGMGDSLYFMHHEHPEGAKDICGMQSYLNSSEVSMAKALAKYLIKNGYNQPGDIAILTPYLGQLYTLREALKSKYMLIINERDQEKLDQAELEEGNEDQISVHMNGRTATGVKSDFPQTQLTLSTVENYQGEKAQIVIISLVRNKLDSNSSTFGKIEFLKSPNRTNVLLSRAQHGMFIIGNTDLMDRETNGIWPSVIKELRAQNRVGAGLPLSCKTHPESVRIVGSAKKLKNATPSGGCTLRCARGMPCGHICPRKCHPEDTEHRLVKCYRPCHQKKNPSTIVCKAKVARKSPTCSHKYESECWDKTAKVVCSKPCDSELPCGHRCTNSCLTCQKGAQHIQCKLKCDKDLFCGHRCDSPCHPNSDCPPCKQSCTVACAHRTCHLPCDSACAACSESCIWTCQHQGQCNMPCGVPCDRLPCHNRCEKSLPCGHQCPSVCGEICPPQKFCVECKDPETMGMQVDVHSLASLGETNVDVNPILVLSCGHAWTMTTMDGMMDMDTYYEGEIDPETEETTYIAKKPLPGTEVKQVSCPSCRNPIMHLLRYGRRIKDAQLSMRLKKYQIIQANDMATVKIQFDNVSAQLDKGRNRFVLAVCNVHAGDVHACDVVSSLSPETRKLGKIALGSDQVLDSGFWKIAETYGIPSAHRAAWLNHIQPVVQVIQELDDINKRAARPPSKQVFEAAVSRLFRLKERHLSEESTDQDSASAIIKECILHCGLSADGNVGSSYVESLAEKTNALLLILSEATAAMESIGPKTGWYWFVQDLHSCCSVYNGVTMEAALKGHFGRRVAYSHVTILELMCSQVHWISLRQLPINAAEKQVRLRAVDNLMEQFMLKVKELKALCPESIKDECLDQSERIENRMMMAVKMARGELPFNHGPTKAERIQVYRAIETTLRGAGHCGKWQLNQTEEKEKEGEEDFEAGGAAAETSADQTRMSTHGVLAAELVEVVKAIKAIKAIKAVEAAVAAMEEMKPVEVDKGEEDEGENKDVKSTEVNIMDRLKDERKYGESKECK
ncbi:hypothetical protein BGZ82_000485 [Podila clonocystis]|nr:hypothetical protein BGZ82_000485 [Podila clonocystis]